MASINGDDSYSTVSDTCVQQRCIREVYENFKKLKTASIAFGGSIRKLHLSLDVFLSTLTEGSIRNGTLQNCNGASTEEPSVPAIRAALQKMLIIAENIDSFTETVSSTNLVEPVLERPKEASTDELINTLKTASSPSGKDAIESVLCKNVIQAHYELKMAKRFHKQFSLSQQEGEIPPILLAKMQQRIDRTTRILSMSIREIIRTNKEYEDFFYAYLRAMSREQGEDAIKPKVGSTRNSIRTNEASAVESADKTNAESNTLEGCLRVMESLTAAFVDTIGTDHN